jgi:hypothetical protein
MYVETFTIVNNSTYDLNLDTTNSRNLDGVWPTSIAARTTSQPFKQSDHASVNPTALYMMAGIASPTNVNMHFFCDGFDPLLHVNMTMSFSSNSAEFAGSSIYENNSNPPITNNTSLAIDVTNDGSSQGSATFTVGTG